MRSNTTNQKNQIEQTREGLNQGKERPNYNKDSDKYKTHGQIQFQSQSGLDSDKKKGVKNGNNKNKNISIDENILKTPTRPDTQNFTNVLSSM